MSATKTLASKIEKYDHVRQIQKAALNIVQASGQWEKGVLIAEHGSIKIGYRTPFR
jgi:hypothetical protein